MMWHTTIPDSFLSVWYVLPVGPLIGWCCCCCCWCDNGTERLLLLLLLLLLVLLVKFRFTPGTLAVERGTDTTRLGVEVGGCCPLDACCCSLMCCELCLPDTKLVPELFDCTVCRFCCFDDTIFGVRFCMVGSVGVPVDAVKIAPVVSDFGWEMQNWNIKQ